MKTFTHHNQPYGTVKFTVDKVELCTADENSEEWEKNRAKAGWLVLSGVVVEGSVTSRMFQYANTKDIAGQSYTIAVTPTEYAKGVQISHAM